MASTGRPSLAKRQKEMERQQRAKEKSQQRSQRKEERKQPRPGEIEGEDPDLAGIVPGPQPIPEDQQG